MPNDNQKAQGSGGRGNKKPGVRLREVELEEFGSETAGKQRAAPPADEAPMEPVYDVPVNVRAVLGKSSLEVNQLINLEPGAIIELDRRVGEPVDVYVNNRLVARGEVVIVDDHLGVTMTEILKDGTSQG
jgi:flagellar motor switch protein FliN/FliY